MNVYFEIGTLKFSADNDFRSQALRRNQRTSVCTSYILTLINTYIHFEYKNGQKILRRHYRNFKAMSQCHQCGKFVKSGLLARAAPVPLCSFNNWLYSNFLSVPERGVSKAT